MITVEKQFQIVVQAQRAHEQAGASGVVERSRASQVHTRDHRQAAHPQPTMEREISFVSTCNSPWGISFPSFLSSLSIGGDQNLIVERDTGLIYTFFSLSLFFSFFFPSFIFPATSMTSIRTSCTWTYGEWCRLSSCQFANLARWCGF